MAKQLEMLFDNEHSDTDYYTTDSCTVSGTPEGGDSPNSDTQSLWRNFDDRSPPNSTQGIESTPPQETEQNQTITSNVDESGFTAPVTSPKKAPVKQTDKPLAVQLVDWIQGRRITEGGLEGEFVKVLDWQSKILADIANPEVKTIALSVARGNGKSFLCSLIAASFIMSDGPLLRKRGQAYLVASSFRQARILYEHIYYMIADSDKHRYRIQDTTNIARVTNKRSGAFVQCIGSDPKRAHGLAPNLILADEGAQWEATQRDLMYETLYTSLGKQPNSKLIALGTRSYDPRHWFSRMLDEDGMADAVHLYSTDMDADPFDPESWLQANPSLPHLPDLYSAIANEAERAKKDTQALQTFRKLRLNQAVQDLGKELVIDPQSLLRVERNELPTKQGRMALGIDVGGNKAMTAGVAYWPATGRVEYLSAFPAIPNLIDRGLEDVVEDRYVQMHRDGDLITCGSKVMDVPQFLTECYERFQQYPDVVVSDRYKRNELEEGLKLAGYPLCRAVYRTQHYRESAEDVSIMRRLILNEEVAMYPSLLMRHSMAGAMIVSDSQGNQKLATKTEGGRRISHRDDVVAALILALAEGHRSWGVKDTSPVKKPWRVKFVG